MTRVETPSPPPLAIDGETFADFGRAKAEERKTEMLRLAETADADTLYEHVADFARLDRAGWGLCKLKIQRRLKRMFGVRDFEQAMKEARAEDRKARQIAAKPREDLTLTPGEHIDGAGNKHEIGNNAFAREIVERLPGETLYRRGDVAAEILGEPGRRKFQAATDNRVRLLIDKHATCGAWRSKGQGDEAVQFMAMVPSTRDHAGLVLAEAQQSGKVPAVRLLTRVPVYGPDWTLCRPGLNSEGVYYDEAPELRGVKPITCAATITATLDDRVLDFPFACPDGTDASRQNFIGLLLTSVVRWAYPGNTPLGMVLASLERTGKTKLASVVLGGVTLGYDTPAMPLVAKDDELEKRVTAFLLAGQTVTLLDNLATHLDSPVLAALLTSKTYLGRVLGASNVVEMPNTLSLVATANNPTLSGEMAKRWVPIKLQPKSANPEKRNDFAHPDLETYVAKNRANVVGCLLGAVELWKDAGRPAGTFRMGGFEGWSRTVGGILDVLGYDQFMGNFAGWVRRADPEGADKAALVRAWWRDHQDRPVGAAELVALCRTERLYPDCLVSPSESGQALSLSRRVLRKLVDQPVDRFIVRAVSSGSSTSYRLEATSDEDRSGPSW
ncbi:MAG: hypothetical protein AAGJ38_01045 [Planctomycetota bacterium]